MRVVYCEPFFLPFHRGLKRIKWWIHLCYSFFIRGVRPGSMVTIDPKCIKNAIQPKYRIRKNNLENSVFSKDVTPYFEDLTQMYKYVSVEQRLLYGVNWCQTDEMKILTKKIRNGFHPDGCKDVADLYKRMIDLENVLTSIQEKGVILSLSTKDVYKSIDMPAVSISENNEFYFNGGGYHRFAMAKILGHKAMTARLVGVHKSRWSYKKRMVIGERPLGLLSDFGMVPTIFGMEWKRIKIYTSENVPYHLGNNRS